MRRSWLIASLAIWGLCSGTLSAAAVEPDGSTSVAAAPGFPDYTRQSVAQICLSEYGMGNTSLLDCVAKDDRTKVALSKSWSGIDDRFKSDCVRLLAKRRLNSYTHLDDCIRSKKYAQDHPDAD